MTHRALPALRRAAPTIGFAALCYVPLLLTSPGSVSADTKSYLYLDPGRLLSRAWSMWDPHIGLGTVSHQTIGYLWPMGPWFWIFDRLGVPDWMAQRLWWGTMLFAAGTGVVHLLRRFDWPPVAIWPAAVLYALTPYVLTHIGRLSGVLLPYAGLPWLLGLTIMAVRTRSWRHPALFALVVATVGSVNVTALALAGLAPLLWIVYLAATRQERLGVLARTSIRIGILTVGVNAWWLAGLSVQATHGIEIVRYTETPEVVSRTSTAFEILRGLGYWFFYGGDKLELWAEASYQYTQRPWLIAVTFTAVLMPLVGVILARFRHRGYFLLLLLVGVVVGVGAHPWADATPAGAVMRWFVSTPHGLAFRSLPRVVPLVALGAAVLTGAAVGALAARSRTTGRVALVVAICLGVLGMAPLWQLSMVSDSLAREEIPGYWTDAAEAVDAGGSGTRVLAMPGSDFAAYRWGMTVDPILPGLADRPFVARELVPFGNPSGADLLNSFDLRLQENTLEPGSIAPLARLLRAGDILLRNDLEYERFHLARPRVVWDLVRSAAGLEDPVGFGEVSPNESGPILQTLDEQWLLQEGDLPDPPPVALAPVSDPVPIFGLKPAEAPLLLSGDGAGVVDAAAAALLTGEELLRYTGDMTEEELVEAVESGSALILTDTNRRRGERWGSLWHNRGHTERADEEALREDPADNRLPRFPDASSDIQTVTIQRGGVTADATAYGNPITYAGEERAAQAIDGDPRTGWSVGAFSDARGEQLRLRLDQPTTMDWIRILQKSPDDFNRRITAVQLTFDSDESIRVDLDPSSWDEPGQLVEFPERTITQLEITLLSDTAGDAPRFREFDPLGIQEVVLGPDSPVIDEIVRVPTRALEIGSEHLSDLPLSILLTRIRQAATDRTRGDEERSIRRLVELPASREMQIDATVRLSARAEDDILDQALGHRAEGVEVTASDHLDGSRVERASAAFDVDPSTAWTTPWGQPVDHWLQVDLERPRVFDQLDLSLVTDGRHSVPSRVRILVDGQEVSVVDIGELDDSEEPGATTTVPISFPATRGTSLRLEVIEAREVTSIDWTAARPVAHPIAIAELGVPGVSIGAVPERVDTGCRDDLLSLGGRAIEVRITGTSDDALAGRPLDLALCDAEVVTVPSGPVEILAEPGVDTGFDIDQLVLSSVDEVPDHHPRSSLGSVEVRSSGAENATVSLSGLEPGRPVWFVMGQSFSDGWQASTDGAEVLEHRQVDGYANGWLIVPERDSTEVVLEFTPQRRVDLALVVSLLSAVVCIGVVAVGGRRRRATGPEPVDPARPLAAPRSWRELLLFEGDRPSSVAAGVTVASVLAIGLVLAPPVVAVLLAVAAALGTRFRWTRLPLAMMPAALLATAAMYILVWQVRYGIQPGLEWVKELERAHPVALAAVLALPLCPLVDWLWRGHLYPGSTVEDVPSPPPVSPR